MTTPDRVQVKFCGNSMFPSIREGDYVGVDFFARPRPIDSIQEGQVVVFKNEGEWVVHRVVNILNRKVCKGDWSYLTDSNLMVWGAVQEVNGEEMKICRSRLIAKLSSIDIIFPFRFFKTLRKVLVYAYVLFFRKPKKGDSHILLRKKSTE